MSYLEDIWALFFQ